MQFNLKHNDWDTAFFGFKVGTIIINPCCDSENIVVDVIEEGIKQGYRLIYILKNEMALESRFLFSKYNIQLVDIKVVFSLANLQRKQFSSQVHEYSGNSESLYSLAFQAGKYSRFSLDANFQKGEFERLYRTWVEKSLNKQLADRVYVCEFENDLVGFVTVKLQTEVLSIGLIATDERYRKKGIGTMLFNHIINFAIDSNASKIEVPTQYNNFSACSFYRAQGMLETKKTFIYHLWIN